jgi:hypothetical protein
MNNYGTVHFDNRDATQMYEYLEARIDVLKGRIIELEKENKVLRLAIGKAGGLATEDGAAA